MIFLMQRRSQSPNTLPRLIADCSAPNVMKSDNAPEFKSKKWMEHLDSATISSAFTKAHHPNKNLVERRGGALKAATVHLLTITGCPLQYWCYAMEYVCLLRTVLVRRSLNWSTPHERHWGDRSDISVFRFTFWQPIWYYQPRQSFPKAKMLKGRFLGIAQNIGDAFCFLILTQPDEPTDYPQVLARSVIRKRYPREDPPIVDNNSSTTLLVFYTNDGTTVLKDPSTDLNSDDADPFADVVSDDVAGLQSMLSAPYQNVDLNNDTDSLDDRIIEVYGPPTRRPRLFEEVQCQAPPAVRVLEGQRPTLPVPEEQLSDFDDETPSVHDPSLMPMHSVPNKELTVPSTSHVDGPCDLAAAFATTIGDDGRADDSNKNPEIADGIHHVTQEEEPKPAVLEDVVRQLTRVADDSVNDELFDRFAGHTWDDGMLMFRVRWKTDEESLLPFTLVQRDYPSETAAYVLKHKVGSSAGCHTGGRFTQWACQYQRHYSHVVR